MKGSNITSNLIETLCSEKSFGVKTHAILKYLSISSWHSECVVSVNIEISFSFFNISKQAKDVLEKGEATRTLSPFFYFCFPYHRISC